MPYHLTATPNPMNDFVILAIGIAIGVAIAYAIAHADRKTRERWEGDEVDKVYEHARHSGFGEYIDSTQT